MLEFLATQMLKNLHLRLTIHSQMLFFQHYEIYRLRIYGRPDRRSLRQFMCANPKLDGCALRWAER